jgi:hypothetical protein
MNKLSKIAVAFVMACVTIAAKAQPTNENADFMRSNGKVYVVMAVVVTILLGLFAYLINLDRKISKLERKS